MCYVYVCVIGLGISTCPPEDYARRFERRVAAQIIEGYHSHTGGRLVPAARPFRCNSNPPPPHTHTHIHLASVRGKLPRCFVFFLLWWSVSSGMCVGSPHLHPSSCWDTPLPPPLDPCRGIPQRHAHDTWVPIPPHHQPRPSTRPSEGWASVAGAKGKKNCCPPKKKHF